MIAALLYRSFSRARGLLVALTAVLVAFQVLVVVAATYLAERGGFSQFLALLPAFVQQMAGAVFSSFASMVAFGYFHPVVIITFVGTGIVIASEPAADVESGAVDLVLARPLPRSRLVLRSILMTAATTMLMAGLMVTASRTGLVFLAEPGAGLSTRALLKLATNLVAVAWVMGALSLLLATIARRRGTAAGGAGIIGLALYFLNFLAEVWPRLRPYAPFSPFHYYQPTAIVSGTGGSWAADVMMLVAAAAALSLTAFALFARRDL
jgi:hypothetical protein